MSQKQREAFVECAKWKWGRENGPSMTRPPWIVSEALAEALCRYPDSPLGNVRECMIELLKENGYDGLYNRCNPRSFGECFCQIDDKGRTIFCDTPSGVCRPGVLVDGKIVAKGEHSEGENIPNEK